MPITGAALVTAGIGAYHLIKGIGDDAAAKKRAQYNIRPTYDIQPEYFQNQGMAANLAQGGLTDSAKNFYETNAERGLGSSLGALMQTGGGVNSVQKLYDTYDRNNQAIAAQDSEAKINNIKNLMAVNNQLADQKTQKWVIDKYQPYLDTAKSIAGQKQQGAAEQNSGLEGIAGAATAYAKGVTPSADKVTDMPYGAAGSNTTGALTASDAAVYTPTSVPIQPLPANAQNITIPDSYDALPANQQSNRNVAIGGILNQYKNSPYYSGLSQYLQTGYSY